MADALTNPHKPADVAAPDSYKLPSRIRPEIKLYNHQVEGIRDLMHRSSFLLGDQPGLGKTLTALTVAAIDFDMGWAKRVLIITPATLKGNWAAEVAKFTTFSALTLDGTPAKRRKQLQQFAKDGTEVLIINYELVAKHIDDLQALGFDIAIADEAHAIKNYKSVRSKAVRQLKVGRRMPLTASPIMNRADELWPILNWISPEEFPNYWRFVNRYALFGGYGGKQVVGVKRVEELRETLDGYMLRRLKSDVLDLPPKLYTPVLVDLHPAQREIYDQVEQELLLQIPGDPTPMEIESGMTKMLRLKQIVSTPANLELPDTSAKLDVAVDRANDLLADGERVVIFTQFRGTLASLEARFRSRGIKPYALHGDVPQSERRPIVDAWSSSKPAPLLAMLQVGAVGLTLTAASTAIFVDKLWTPEMNTQAEDRLHRIGTTETVQIIDLIAARTIEQRIQKVLQAKEDLFDNIVDYKRALYRAATNEED